MILIAFDRLSEHKHLITKSFAKLHILPYETIVMDSIEGFWVLELGALYKFEGGIIEKLDLNVITNI